MELITTDEVIGVNALLSSLYDFPMGLLNRGTLEAAVDRANFGPFYLETTLHGRIAFLVRGLAQDHPFLDGNKRTAAATAIAIYRVHEYSIRATPQEFAGFILHVAMGEAGYMDIVAWLRAHAQKS